MKKELSVFLCAVAALFFGSCTDLSMSKEEALEADLPAEFNWEEYAEINKDVAMSQIILSIKNNWEDTLSKAQNCVSLLHDDEVFAKEIYVNYAQCPVDGWSLDEACPGIYANNRSYHNAEGKCTAAAIGDCAQGGWDDVWASLPDDLDAYLTKLEATPNAAATVAAVRIICQFLPKADSKAVAQNYLKDFEFVSFLVEQHYHSFGLFDGRPYK
ncbi:MAG: hypothetical protein LBB36_04065, partial [Fibromonadaceae bacterium]|nr:hypothetical protein [Fibromonadaceae bacterium]